MRAFSYLHEATCEHSVIYRRRHQRIQLSAGDDIRAFSFPGILDYRLHAARAALYPDGYHPSENNTLAL